MLIELCHFD